MSKSPYPFGLNPSNAMIQLVLRRCVEDIGRLSGDPELYKIRSSITAEIQATATAEEPAYAEAFRADVIKSLESFLSPMQLETE